MSLFSLVIALLLEQFRPLPYRRFVLAPLTALADFLEAHLNGGERQHGILAWAIAVIVPTAVAGIVYYSLLAISPLLALLCNVGVLYLTLGFRRFSHYFTDIQLALRMGDLSHARQLLGQWRGAPVDAMSSDEIARAAIELALVASHRHVFGVIVGFVLLPGPCGAVLYRSAAFLAAYWGTRSHAADVPAPAGEFAEFGAFGDFSARAFAVIDWLPVRATAAAFAVVGDFEDAVYCWRTQADRVHDAGIGIVLASGAGALGVRLGRQTADSEVELSESGDLKRAEGAVELGAGDDADADHMQSAVGLLWRALLLSLLLLLLLGFASLAGV
jgi:cobalamin biosynthesis protein CobD/CbiB